MEPVSSACEPQERPATRAIRTWRNVGSEGKVTMLNKNFQERAELVWAKLSEEIGGAFLHREEGGGRHDKVFARVDNWSVTLDLHSENGSEVLYTRYRAPYINPDGFRFNIYHADFWDNISRAVGFQDVIIGDEVFDDHFRIMGNDERLVRRLFSNRKLRELLKQEPEAHLFVRDSGDWFAEDFPDGVDELVLEVEGEIADLERLARMYGIFAEALRTLCHIGAAYENDPEIVLE